MQVAVFRTIAVFRTTVVAKTKDDYFAMVTNLSVLPFRGSIVQSWARVSSGPGRTHAGRVQYRELRGGQAGRSTWRELDQLSLQLDHLVIGGILACMDCRKANKDWPVWFDPWVCLASSGSVCVNHFIYAWIGIADVGAWIRPILRHELENKFSVAAFNPARAVCCASGSWSTTCSRRRRWPTMLKHCCCLA